MKINKIINNNVISVIQNNKELVVMGKGIGFQKREGDIVEESKIDKIFTLNSTDISNQFKTLLIEVPLEVVQTVEKIISFTKEKYNKTLNDAIYVALTDHINFAIERQKEGIPVQNGLLWEIKKFYQNEYEIGLTALKWIEEDCDVKLPEDEAGFIAIHILNAENNNKSDFNQITDIVHNVLSLVKYHFQIELNENSFSYYRFVTHLKFFAQRILTKNNLYKEEQSLYEIVKKKYPDSFYCVKKIDKYLGKKYDYQISEEEKLYLMIHINRLITRNESVDIDYK